MTDPDTNDDPRLSGANGEGEGDGEGRDRDDRDPEADMQTSGATTRRPVDDVDLAEFPALGKPAPLPASGADDDDDGIGDFPMLGASGKAAPQSAGAELTMGALQAALVGSDDTGLIDKLSATGDASTRYTDANEIARGGMGRILSAVDGNLGRSVAMKVILADGKSGSRARQRFVREAQITGQLEHPNIVPVHELGVDADRNVYFTMKLVKGHSLTERLDQLRDAVVAGRGESVFPLGERLDVFRKICDALAFAHSRQVIHRDLKPDNVMLGEFGEVQVMDWGLGKVLGEAEFPVDPSSPTQPDTERLNVDETDSALTMQGDVVGTPRYMAPEQAAGDQSAVNASTDIYALGAILFEMLALRPAIQADSSMQSLALVVAAEFDAPSTRVAADKDLAGKLRVAPDLEAVVLKAMARRPPDRYATVSDLRREIDLFLDGRAVGAARYTLTQRLRKWSKRNRATVIAGSLIAAVVIVGLVVGVYAIAEARRAQTQQALQQERTRLDAAASELTAMRLRLDDGLWSRVVDDIATFGGNHGQALRAFVESPPAIVGEQRPQWVDEANRIIADADALQRDAWIGWCADRLATFPPVQPDGSVPGATAQQETEAQSWLDRFGARAAIGNDLPVAEFAWWLANVSANRADELRASLGGLPTPAQAATLRDLEGAVAQWTARAWSLQPSSEAAGRCFLLLAERALASGVQGDELIDVIMQFHLAWSVFAPQTPRLRPRALLGVAQSLLRLPPDAPTPFATDVPARRMALTALFTLLTPAGEVGPRMQMYLEAWPDDEQQRLIRLARDSLTAARTATPTLTEDDVAAIVASDVPVSEPVLAKSAPAVTLVRALLTFRQPAAAAATAGRALRQTDAEPSVLLELHALQLQALAEADDITTLLAELQSLPPKSRYVPHVILSCAHIVRQRGVLDDVVPLLRRWADNASLTATERHQIRRALAPYERVHTELAGPGVLVRGMEVREGDHIVGSVPELQITNDLDMIRPVGRGDDAFWRVRSSGRGGLTISENHGGLPRLIATHADDPQPWFDSYTKRAAGVPVMIDGADARLTITFELAGAFSDTRHRFGLIPFGPDGFGDASTGIECEDERHTIRWRTLQLPPLATLLDRRLRLDSTWLASFGVQRHVLSDALTGAVMGATITGYDGVPPRFALLGAANSGGIHGEFVIHSLHLRGAVHALDLREATTQAEVSNAADDAVRVRLARNRAGWQRLPQSFTTRVLTDAARDLAAGRRAVAASRLVELAELSRVAGSEDLAWATAATAFGDWLDIEAARIRAADTDGLAGSLAQMVNARKRIGDAAVLEWIPVLEAWLLDKPTFAGEGLWNAAGRALAPVVLPANEDAELFLWSEFVRAENRVPTRIVRLVAVAATMGDESTFQALVRGSMYTYGTPETAVLTLHLVNAHLRQEHPVYSVVYGGYHRLEDAVHVAESLPDDHPRLRHSFRALRDETLARLRQLVASAQKELALATWEAKRAGIRVRE